MPPRVFDHLGPKTLRGQLQMHAVRSFADICFLHVLIYK